MNVRIIDIEDGRVEASTIINTSRGKEIEAYETGHTIIVAIGRLKRLLTHRIRKKNGQTS